MLKGRWVSSRIPGLDQARRCPETRCSGNLGLYQLYLALESFGFTLPGAAASLSKGVITLGHSVQALAKGRTRIPSEHAGKGEATD